MHYTLLPTFVMCNDIKLYCTKEQIFILKLLALAPFSGIL